MTQTPLRDNPLHDHTAAVRQIMQLVDVAASRRATVVVAGESEIGLETIARAIHIRGDRSDGALVKIDCSKLSASELEQELFGVTVKAGRGATTDGEDLE